MVPSCEGCVLRGYKAIAKFYENNGESLRFCREHGVLPKAVNFPKCIVVVYVRQGGECRHPLSLVTRAILTPAIPANLQNNVGGLG